jgi:hypothetical protein
MGRIARRRYRAALLRCGRPFWIFDSAGPKPCSSVRENKRAWLIRMGGLCRSQGAGATAMTPAQTQTVQQLRDEGFLVSSKNNEIVRLTRGADKRIVMADGTQKRAHHTHYQEAV